MPDESSDLAALLARFNVVTTTCDAGPRAFEIHHPRSADALIDEAAFAEDERLPYWADVWPSARILAGHLVRHQWDGRAALELGCGSGLVACALAAAGYRVTATDYDEDALAFTRANVWANLGQAIETRLLDWRTLPSDVERFDIVGAADVLYERSFAECVAEAIGRLVRCDGYAIVADPGRVGAEPFLSAAASRGLAVREEWDVPYQAEGQRHTIRMRVLFPSATAIGQWSPDELPKY